MTKSFGRAGPGVFALINMEAALAGVRRVVRVHAGLGVPGRDLVHSRVMIMSASLAGESTRARAATLSCHDDANLAAVHV